MEDEREQGVFASFILQGAFGKFSHEPVMNKTEDRRTIFLPCYNTKTALRTFSFGRASFLYYSAQTFSRQQGHGRQRHCMVGFLDGHITPAQLLVASPIAMMGLILHGMRPSLALSLTSSSSSSFMSGLALSGSSPAATRRRGKCRPTMCRMYRTTPRDAIGLDVGDDDAAAATTPTTTSTATTTSASSFAASRLGLDPCSNRFHAPIVYHEQYSFDDWPTTHTFPMDKFDRTAKALTTTNNHLPRPLVRSSQDFFRPLDYEHVPVEWFTDAGKDADFVHRFLQGRLSSEEARWIGFREQCQRPELIQRTVLEVAGTILTSQLACRYGLASHVAGGTHHAHPMGGAGFTILNDLAVTAHHLCTTTTTRTTNQPNIQRVLVIDCDVHQGDGTAKFMTLWDQDPQRHGRLFTLSLHCASNYPHPKAHSTYDIGLPDKCEDDEYMKMLQTSVDRALDEVQPDFVLYDAGVDVYEHDKLGRLCITLDGIRARDRWVLDRCVSAGIPVAAVIGGGYDIDVEALGRRHAIVHEECAYVWRKHRLWECHDYADTK